MNGRHKQDQKIRRIALDVIDQVGDYNRALGWMRYEAMRELDVSSFASLYRRNLFGEPWDDMIDDIIIEQEEAGKR